MDESVGAALRTLRVHDARLAQFAGDSWDTMAGESEPDGLTQWRVQEFCWYELPISRGADPDGQWEVASALAALLERLGLQRYARIVRSDTTRTMLRLGREAARTGNADPHA